MGRDHCFLWGGGGDYRNHKTAGHTGAGRLRYHSAITWIVAMASLLLGAASATDKKPKLCVSICLTACLTACLLAQGLIG